MNKDEETKNVELNKDVDYIEVTSNVDTSSSIDDMLKKESQSFT